jgi:predicted amidohydrolase YtcJ
MADRPSAAGGRRHRDGATATVVVRGATVLPVDPAFGEAEALAMRDGRILAVGSEAEVRAAAGDDAMAVDRPGATILPGFIEPHAHVLPTALFGSWEDLGALRFSTVAAAMDHLATVALDHDPDDGWILGRQFDPSLQAGPDELTIDLLDRISADVPVAVLNASLHFGYVNSAALRIAGVAADTADLDGSPYGRRDDGSPNGVLKGQPAMLSVLAHNPGLADTDLVAAGLTVSSRASSTGVTTICDQGTGGVLGPGDVDLYSAMAATGRLATRLRYSAMDLRADAFDESGLRPGDGDDLIRSTGWKIISDGSNQGRTGHQREPYMGGHDRGLAYVEPDDLAEIVRRRAEQGWQVVVHANGDQAIDDVLAAFEALDPSLRADRRHRIEHCSILHDDQIRRIAALGLSPSFLIGHVHFWGQAFRDDLIGPERANLLDRTASCTEAGITWTIHSDEMVTPIDPLRCIENTVTRNLWREPGSVLAPDERVPVEQAIRAMTADAAWQCHSENEIGTLEPGKLADFVVLDADPRSVDPSEIRHIEVLETWMGGRRVYPVPRS